MALTSLGNLDHALVLDWKPYNSIELVPGCWYPLYARVSCDNFDLAYSTFELRVTGNTESSDDVSEYVSPVILAESGTQLIRLFLFQQWSASGSFVFSVRRIPTVFSQSNLAFCSVELLIDPETGYHTDNVPVDTGDLANQLLNLTQEETVELLEPVWTQQMTDLGLNKYAYANVLRDMINQAQNNSN